jgi:hypothetical protein
MWALALPGRALYPVLVHRLAASLRTSDPQSVTLMQLRFTSFAVINSRWDLHPQGCAHQGGFLFVAAPQSLDGTKLLFGHRSEGIRRRVA